MLHSLSVLFCSPSPPRSPSTLFHSSFSTSPFLLFPLFPIFLPLVPLSPPPPTETFIPRFLYSRSFPKFYELYSRRRREEEEAEFRSAEHPPSGGAKSASSRPRRFSSRWKTISTLVGVNRQPAVDDRISWRNCLGIEASPLASSSPEWLTVRFSVFLRSLREYSASFASLSKMSKSLCAETIVPCTTVMIV